MNAMEDIFVMAMGRTGSQNQILVFAQIAAMYRVDTAKKGVKLLIAFLNLIEQLVQGMVVVFMQFVTKDFDLSGAVLIKSCEQYVQVIFLAALDYLTACASVTSIREAAFCSQRKKNNLLLSF